MRGADSGTSKGDLVRGGREEDELTPAGKECPNR
jgi:hypothetical protein